ncbi:MAG: septum formation initiator family protein [Nitriliruptoraceae bacterium]
MSYVVHGVVGAFRGDRPLILGLFAVIALGAVMLVGPLQSYLDARERVQVLELQDRVVSDEVARLQQRVQDLDDPEHIELLAREQQGFIWPGEVPYRIIPPDHDRPQITDAQPLDQPWEPLPWHQQLWHQLQRWLGNR